LTIYHAQLKETTNIAQKWLKLKMSSEATLLKWVNERLPCAGDDFDDCHSHPSANTPEGFVNLK
jgi:hypothetical protein